MIGESDRACEVFQILGKTTLEGAQSRKVLGYGTLTGRGQGLGLVSYFRLSNNHLHGPPLENKQESDLFIIRSVGHT